MSAAGSNAKGAEPGDLHGSARTGGSGSRRTILRLSALPDASRALPDRPLRRDRRDHPPRSRQEPPGRGAAPLTPSAAGPAPAPSSTAAADERRLARRAGSVSLGVIVSRFSGLLREQVLAYLFPTALLDGFFAAYTFPNTLRELLAEGALSKAFVATFAAVDARDGPEAAHRLFVRAFRALFLLALLVTVLGVVFAPALVDLVFSREAFSEPLPEALGGPFATGRDLTVWLTRVMFPFIFFAALAALFMGGLHARHRFFFATVASSFFNVAAITFALVGVLAAPALGLHPMAGLAIGVPVGGLAQLAAQAGGFRRTGFRRTPSGGVRATLRDPAFRRMARLFAPAAGAAGTLQLNVLISRHFASAGTSWLSWFSMAYRLAQLPAGLIGVALSHAGLPSLTRASGSGDPEGFARVLTRVGQLVLLLGLASTAGLIAVAEPLVALIYQRGAFTAADAAQVAAMLSVFALGLPAFGTTKILTDAFFALGSTRPPLLVAIGATGATYLLTRAFVLTAGLDHLGLPLAVVSVSALSAGAQAALLAPRLGRDRLGRSRARAVYSDLGRTALRGVVVALLVGGAAAAAAAGIRAVLEPGLLSALAATLLPAALGVVVFALAARRLAPVEYAPLRAAAAPILGRLGFLFRRRPPRGGSGGGPA